MMKMPVLSTPNNLTFSVSSNSSPLTSLSCHAGRRSVDIRYAVDGLRCGQWPVRSQCDVAVVAAPWQQQSGGGGRFQFQIPARDRSTIGSCPAECRVSYRTISRSNLQQTADVGSFGNGYARGLHQYRRKYRCFAKTTEDK